MVDKLHEYEGWLGRAHIWRDQIRARVTNWQKPIILKDLQAKLSGKPRPPTDLEISQVKKSDEDYSHIYRKKTRRELVRISSAVMGIEFSYAGETAFVSPTLLKIGVEHQHMTLVWALSPLVGFFLTPILGSLSDRCRMSFGRRRPFILLLSVGVFLGLLLVPNGEDIGYALGDVYTHRNETEIEMSLPILSHRTSANKDIEFNINNSTDYSGQTNAITPHPWGVFFTILGTVLLDFDADACQSPARAYLLDVTLPEDHARGLSTFTVMAGLGGFCGYALGGINWDVTALGVLFGGHVRAVFSLITVIFIICVTYTITSFDEIPLNILEDEAHIHDIILTSNAHDENKMINCDPERSYGAVEDNVQLTTTENKNPFKNALNEMSSDGGSTENFEETNPFRHTVIETTNDCLCSDQNTSYNCEKEPYVSQVTDLEETISLKHYLLSIVIMPFSLRIVCLTNLFCWMAHVCYSLYFTDFVGEAVFHGNPAAPEGSLSRDLYEQGVRFGCWGMSMYSLSCACYSLVIEKLIKKYGAKKMYIGGLLTYSLGMMLMALTKHKAGVIFFSWTAGVMYSTLFTMPYLLVAHYHARGVFEVTSEGEAKFDSQLRGLGTDVAIVSSMVFLAQFMLSMCMGSIVSYSGTTTAVVSVASCLAFLGAISASQIMYLDL
ncbi:loss of visual transmission [Arctopsyche grandis]|uniref:loss of visual transmission n=1 Tax=Arctopsyche grandis TaxID=121162 RepID=UPI00406D9658